VNSIIGLSGYAGAGKDTVCKEVIKRIPEMGYQRYGLADFLKDLMCIALSCTREQLENMKDDPDIYMRQRMIDFSEEGIKLVDKEFWVKRFYQIIKSGPGHNWITTDIRYWEEYFFFLRMLKLEEYISDVLFIFVDCTDAHVTINRNCGNEIAQGACHIYFDNVRDPSTNEIQLDNLVNAITQHVKLKGLWQKRIVV